MINVILTYATKYLGPVVAVLGAILAVFRLGKNDAKQEQKIEDLEDTLKVKEKLDEVEPSNNRAAAIKRLRDSGLIRKD